MHNDVITDEKLWRQEDEERKWKFEKEIEEKMEKDRLADDKRAKEVEILDR